MSDITKNIDATVTPEGAALCLLQIVARIEGKLLTDVSGAVTRDYVLSTYAQCLRIATGTAFEFSKD